MERKRELTKILLAESFKELLIKGSFDKITIKMITDQAGVIRPTFYNYFQDKYEVMEWLLETEVFQHIREMTEDGMEREAIYLLFRKMEKDRIYYQKAFEATGQNGFEEILEKKIRQLIEEMVGRHKIKLEKLQGIKDKKIFLEFHTITVVTGLKYWLTSREHCRNCDQECRGTASIQMSDHSNDTGHHGNTDYITSDFLHQCIDDLVEHSYICHNSKEKYREDKQRCSTMYSGYTGCYKFPHFFVQTAHILQQIRREHNLSRHIQPHHMDFLTILMECLIHQGSPVRVTPVIVLRHR